MNSQELASRLSKCSLSELNDPLTVKKISLHNLELEGAISMLIDVARRNCIRELTEQEITRLAKKDARLNLDTIKQSFLDMGMSEAEAAASSDLVQQKLSDLF